MSSGGDGEGGPGAGDDAVAIGQLDDVVLNETAGRHLDGKTVRVDHRGGHTVECAVGAGQRNEADAQRGTGGEAGALDGDDGLMRRGRAGRADRLNREPTSGR